MATERMVKLAKTNFWNELIAMRDTQREQRKTAVQVVKAGELPQENNEIGLMRWYLHPSITDTLCSTFMFYEQEIPPGDRSGRLLFQGGQVIVVIEGKGHTLIDGVKHSWVTGDVLNLPLKRDGIVVQHVNDSDEEPAKFIAVEPNWFACTSVDRGSGFEVLEEAPNFRAGGR
jgi:gentisate 1,2-dioxygenase